MFLKCVCHPAPNDSGKFTTIKQRKKHKSWQLWWTNRLHGLYLCHCFCHWFDFCSIINFRLLHKSIESVFDFIIFRIYFNFLIFILLAHYKIFLFLWAQKGIFSYCCNHLFFNRRNKWKCLEAGYESLTGMNWSPRNNNTLQSYTVKLFFWCRGHALTQSNKVVLDLEQ